MLPATASEQERLGSLDGVEAFQICFFLSEAENKFLFPIIHTWILSMLYQGRGYIHLKILETESGWNTSPSIGSSLLTTPAPQLWSIFCSSCPALCPMMLTYVE